MNRSETLRPRPAPCSTCPYRRDVPSGIWDASEYRKLPLYDVPTGEQPTGVFLCHQADGFVCAGWCGCHDMGNNLALRMARVHHVDVDTAACRDYTSPVPLFASGTEACEHGMRDIRNPGPDARAQADRITTTRRRKATAKSAAVLLLLALAGCGESAAAAPHPVTHPSTAHAAVKAVPPKPFSVLTSGPFKITVLSCGKLTAAQQQQFSTDGPHFAVVAEVTNKSAGTVGAQLDVEFTGGSAIVAANVTQPHAALAPGQSEVQETEAVDPSSNPKSCGIVGYAVLDMNGGETVVAQVGHQVDPTP